MGCDVGKAVRYSKFCATTSRRSSAFRRQDPCPLGMHDEWRLQGEGGRAGRTKSTSPCLWPHAIRAAWRCARLAGFAVGLWGPLAVTGCHCSGPDLLVGGGVCYKDKSGRAGSTAKEERGSSGGVGMGIRSWGVGRSSGASRSGCLCGSGRWLRRWCRCVGPGWWLCSCAACLLGASPPCPLYCVSHTQSMGCPARSATPTAGTWLVSMH